MTLPAATPTIAPGTQVGKYQILRLLAVGGMAEIYLARSTGIGGFEKTVVLKRILPALAQNPEFVDMFLDEARLTASFSHPNVVQVHDVDKIGDSFFFTMDFVHGRNLAEVLRQAAAKKRGLSLAHALYVVSNVAAGLHYAHAKKGRDGQPLGTVHRDISPSNVMLSFDGLVKIVDFGIAKAAVRHSKTKTGTVKGTIYYMSPEQAQGLEMDRRSDVWSLGVLLYELTTGTRPFKAPNDFAILYKIVHEGVPAPSERRPGYSPELERIVLKALERSPTDRYQTADELKNELDACARDQNLIATSSSLAAFLQELFDSRDDTAQMLAVPMPASEEVEVAEQIETPKDPPTSITSATSTSRIVPMQRAPLWLWLALPGAGVIAIVGWMALGNHRSTPNLETASSALRAAPSSTPSPMAPIATEVPAPEASPPPSASAAVPAAAPPKTERVPKLDTTRPRSREAKPPPSSAPKDPSKWNLDSPLPP